MEISGVNSQASYFTTAMQQSKGPPKGPSFDDLLGKLDANGDDGLSIDEVSISEEAFAQADANADGVIDESEFDSGGNKIIGDDLKAQGKQPPMGPPPPQGGEPSFAEVLSQWDADGDSALSIDELGASETAFAEADSNDDGVIDQTEFDSGGNKILGDDLRSRGPQGPPPQASTDESASGSGSSSGASAYQYLQNLFQSETADTSRYSSILMSSLNMIA